MALKQLATFKVSSAPGTGASSVVYTCPASTRAFIKEIILNTRASVSPTTAHSQTYILPTGGTDKTPDSLGIEADAGSIDATALHSQVTEADTTGTVTVIAVNTILEAGDALKLLRWNTGGSPTIGASIIVSGDETAT